MGRHSHPSLRSLLAFTFGAVALLAAACMALLGGKEAASRITAGEIADLNGMTGQFAATLAEGIAQHQDAVQAVARLPGIVEPGSSAQRRAKALAALRSVLPDFAVLAMLGTDGLELARAPMEDTLVVSTGRRDLTAPVHAADGRKLGSIVGVLSRDWVRAAAHRFQGALPDSTGAELLVLSRDGRSWSGRRGWKAAS